MKYRFELRVLEMKISNKPQATHYVYDNKRKGIVKIGDHSQCSRWVQAELEATTNV